MTAPAKSKHGINKHKIARTSVSLLLVALIILFGVDLYVSNNFIEVSRYTLETESVTGAPVRIAIVTDLHLKDFGNGNEELFDLLKAEQPDVILTVGDMIDKTQIENEHLDKLSITISALCQIAPVYSSLGNHERSNPLLSDIKEAIKLSGATLLDMEYVDTELCGTAVRIGGISYYRNWDEQANAFLQDFSAVADNRLTLLLCHNPEFYIWGIKNYPIDLVASGHTHGGMARLPIFGGLYAPEQGWFPEYDAGLFEEAPANLAVSRGLSSSPKYIPRIYNRPEIMIIEVT